jgi:hypothetical protein
MVEGRKWGLGFGIGVEDDGKKSTPYNACTYTTPLPTPFLHLVSYICKSSSLLLMILILIAECNKYRDEQRNSKSQYRLSRNFFRAVG